MIRISFSTIQTIAISPLLAEAGKAPGSAIIAQVWADGIVARTITKDEAAQIAEILGQDPGECCASSEDRMAKELNEKPPGNLR